jgi:hypothetical protein
MRIAVVAVAWLAGFATSAVADEVEFNSGLILDGCKLVAAGIPQKETMSINRPGAVWLCEQSKNLLKCVSPQEDSEEVLQVNAVVESRPANRTVFVTGNGLDRLIFESPGAGNFGAVVWASQSYTPDWHSVKICRGHHFHKSAFAMVVGDVCSKSTEEWPELFRPVCKVWNSRSANAPARLLPLNDEGESAAVRIGDEDLGDKGGRMVIKTQFDDAEAFSEGLSRASAMADFGDGKPMTPSGITAFMAGCVKQAPDNGADPTFQAAFCACQVDYIDGLKPRAVRSLAKGFETGELPRSFVKAGRTCATWAERNLEKPLDRTPYSRKKVISSAKTVEAYVRCEKTGMARSKGSMGVIEYCDKFVTSLRNQ